MIDPCEHCGADWEPRPERDEEDEGNMIHRVHQPACPIYKALEDGTYYSRAEWREEPLDGDGERDQKLDR